jgi:hypothetical protein
MKLFCLIYFRSFLSYILYVTFWLTLRYFLACSTRFHTISSFGSRKMWLQILKHVKRTAFGDDGLTTCHVCNVFALVAFYNIHRKKELFFFCPGHVSHETFKNNLVIILYSILCNITMHKKFGTRFQLKRYLSPGTDLFDLNTCKGKSCLRLNCS